MTDDIRELLDQYRVLWQSYLTGGPETIKSDLVDAMEQIRDRAGLTSDEWETFTASLPGFTEWWSRVRGEYLDKLDRQVTRMEE